jgi:hypothetical protein
MPKGSQVGGFDLLGLVYLVVVLAVLFLPLLLGRSSSPPGPPEPGSDDGGGGSPPRPPKIPSSPSGGIPLPDAQPARVRLRDRGQLADRLPARQRRPSPHPDRERVPMRGRA